MTDPIADYLTRLRNAIKAHHRVVEVPASKLKKEITKILFEKGYILNYKFVEDGPQGTIKVALKYDPVNKVNAIKKLERISSPGLSQDSKRIRGFLFLSDLVSTLISAGNCIKILCV